MRNHENVQSSRGPAPARAFQNPEAVAQAADNLRDALPPDFAPRTGIVLGTGLGAWAASLSAEAVVNYADIPGFPRSTVQSHAGSLTAARVGGAPVLLLSGRFHLYEGYSPAEVCMGVRTMAALGVERLVITNAAGALNPHFEAGSLMCISDHINFTGASPLMGPNHDAWGDRFPDMSRAYAKELQQLAQDAALVAGVRLERGVYIGVNGPNLETPAETRAFKRLGADAVGMSTVLEVIAARHLGLEVLGISCLTNKNLPDCMEECSIEQVIAQAEQASGALATLLNAVVPKL